MPNLEDFEDMAERIAETTAERMLKRTPQAPQPTQRSPGRRTADYQKRNAAWILVVGTLMQGGFLAFSWRMMNAGERQMEAERAMLAQQHLELRQDIERQTDAIRELTKGLQQRAQR